MCTMSATSVSVTWCIPLKLCAAVLVQAVVVIPLSVPLVSHFCMQGDGTGVCCVLRSSPAVKILTDKTFYCCIASIQ